MLTTDRVDAAHVRRRLQDLQSTCRFLADHNATRTSSTFGLLASRLGISNRGLHTHRWDRDPDPFFSLVARGADSPRQWLGPDRDRIGLLGRCLCCGPPRIYEFTGGRKHRLARYQSSQRPPVMSTFSSSGLLLVENKMVPALGSSQSSRSMPPSLSALSFVGSWRCAFPPRDHLCRVERRCVPQIIFVI